MLLRVIFILGKRPLLEAVGAARLPELRAKALEAYPGLVGQVPPLPEHSGARTFLEATCALVAFHRALPEQSAADNSALFSAALRHAARLLPRPLRWLYRWLFFQPWYYRALFRSVDGGAGFAGTLAEEPPGRTIIVTYTACGIQRLLKALGASELGPHICELDELESEIFGLGLKRTTTLGRGGGCCDFVWER